MKLHVHVGAKFDICKQYYYYGIIGQAKSRIHAPIALIMPQNL